MSFQPVLDVKIASHRFRRRWSGTTAVESVAVAWVPVSLSRMSDLITTAFAVLADHAVVTAHGHVGEHGGASGRAGFAQRAFAEQGAAATGFGERVTPHDPMFLCIGLIRAFRMGAPPVMLAEVGASEFGEPGHLAAKLRIAGTAPPIQTRPTISDHTFVASNRGIEIA